MARDTTTKTPRKAGGKARAAKAATPPAEGDAESAATGLRMKDLVDQVVAATGHANKKDVRDIVASALLQMGEALKKGESLNLPAFGRVRVARQSAEDGGVMTLKLRQGAPGGGGGKGKAKVAKEGLAEDGDQD